MNPEVLHLVDPTPEAEGGTSIRKEDCHILSQKVSGEFIRFVVYEECVVKCLAFSTDRPDHLRLFRTYVSRTAAKKGRAVLEGVGLRTHAIDACFGSHPLDEEGAVQEGLSKWSEGQSDKPSTWQVLLDAMDYAEIAQVQELKGRLHQGMLLHYIVNNVWQVHVCVCML